MGCDCLAIIDKYIEAYGSGSENLLGILHRVQDEIGYISVEAVRKVSDVMGVGFGQVRSIVSFYDLFRTEPAGEHVVKVCIGTACHVKGAEGVFDAFKRFLRIAPSRDTDDARLFTVEKVACLGCCSLAVAVQIDDLIFGHVKPEGVGLVIKEFLNQKKNAKAKSKKHGENVLVNGQIRMCLDSACVASGNGGVYREFEEQVAELGLGVEMKEVSCHGMNFIAPAAEIVVGGKLIRYSNIDIADVRGILLRHFEAVSVGKRIKGRVELALDGVLEGRRDVCKCSADAEGFLGKQRRIAMERSGESEPGEILEYRKEGGFTAIENCLSSGAKEDVIELLKESGLRGRGGGGFLTYLKWGAVKRESSDVKYIVCNGDEGDPGAFMDRMLMESYPFRLIEGMMIAGWTVGSERGYIYVRSEYPLAIEKLRCAIESCKEAGYLGANILGSGFGFDIKLVMGAGAFVCGEETSLISSIEGKRPLPHLRPPYPAKEGLWGKPTLVNNVETLMNIAWIVRHGHEKYVSHGTETSRGTKVFALAGKVNNGGLIEVAMGMTLREIIDDIGGGVQDGRKLKAIQIGGPSGACIPAEHAGVGVDYESLKGLGGMMGSGGLVVLDDTDCMVDIARYFLEFTQDQSCGKCTFCRVGTRRMLEILKRLCEGDGKEGDIEKLEELAEMIMAGSICGLGKTAPNPVLSTLRYFRDEYEAHINGECPAKKCKALITYVIEDECIGCTKCAQGCPVGAIGFMPYEKHEIDAEKCIRCGMCREICPVDAVKIV